MFSLLIYEISEKKMYNHSLARMTKMALSYILSYSINWYMFEKQFEQMKYDLWKYKFPFTQ